VDELRYLSSPLEPQKARDLEVGLRYRQERASAGVRVFEQRTQNEIAYDNSIFKNINLDPVRRVGIEAEGGFQLSRELKLSAIAQFLRAQLVDGPYAGSQLPLAPKSTVLIRAAYDVNQNHALDGTFRAVGSAPFGNDWTNTCSNSIPQANYLDLGYRYRAQPATGWSAFVGVDNVLDNQTYSVGYTNAACSAYNVYPDSGRRVKLTASYRF
jgi:iron complex outermembrane receptor protein